LAVTSSPRAPSPRGGAPRQHAVVVGQRDAQAVDLQLGDVVERLWRAIVAGKSAADAFVESAEFIWRVGIVETEHRLGVLDRLEARRGAAANAAGRMSRR
jgi:hypothetical protein